MRLSGQDCTRGTFSQRHSGLIDQETEERYYPLNHIREGQAQYEVIDSMLSEYAVLGFEYGYSLAEPNALTCGRRSLAISPTARRSCSISSSVPVKANGCACPGWSACLPHGFEGQGPEHCSARLERFLQCAAGQLDRGQLHTPANYFHILRRQMHRSYPQTADPDDAQIAAAPQDGSSQPVNLPPGPVSTACFGMTRNKAIPTLQLVADDKIKRVVMCSGKVYYDLLEERDARGITMSICCGSNSSIRSPRCRWSRN